MRLALIGWGAIGQTVAQLLGDAPIEIVAVARRSSLLSSAEIPSGARLIVDPDELAATQPDLVAEAASRESVGPWGRAALTAGADFIVSSVSALADAQLLTSLRELAAQTGTQVQIQTGALAGIDALASARLMGVEAVEHRIIKPPGAWVGTPAETLCTLDDLDGPVEFFSGTAAETASTFPKNANVAMTTALAGIGPDMTKIALVADPSTTTNRHELSANGAFGQLDVTIANNPLPANPKTSALAALSLARCITNRASAIVI